MTLDVVFQYSSLYPVNAKPFVMVRSNDLNATELNRELRLYIESLAFEEPLTVNIIQWIQDNCCQFQRVDSPGPKVETQPGPQKWDRLWIYSHHLYSVIKRRNISSEARSLKLKGFFVSGKPGIIIVEGLHENCQKFWEAIVTYGWKKIIIRHREEFADASSLKLQSFKEICLASTDGKSIKYSDLKKLLTDMGLEYGFHILLNL